MTCSKGCTVAVLAYENAAAQRELATVRLLLHLPLSSEQNKLSETDATGL
jgi:hypothetical protein